MAEGTAAPIPVRCRCGQVYQADPAHVGRKLRCRCGRIVAIEAARARGPSLLRRARALFVARPARHWVDHLPAVYLGVVVLSALVLWGLGDVWWPATLLLFGPRWILLLPLVALVPLALLRRRGIGALLLGTAVVIGPVMGFHAGIRNWLGAPPATLRFMTFNVEGGNEISLAVLDSLKVDIATFEECGPRLAQRVTRAARWHTAVRFNLCFLSRWPITAVDTLGAWQLGNQGFSGFVASYTVDRDGHPMHVVNLHLDTPRKGLEPLRAGSGADPIRTNIGIRDIGSDRARNWVRAIPGPLLIAGDFNMPVESRIFRRYWSDFTDAFSQAGVGFGGSRVLRRFRVRIDHILLGDGWRATRAFVGPDLGSDHRPVIADLAWTGAT